MGHRCRIRPDRFRDGCQSARSKSTGQVCCSSFKSSLELCQICTKLPSFDPEFGSPAWTVRSRSDAEYHIAAVRSRRSTIEIESPMKKSRWHLEYRQLGSLRHELAATERDRQVPAPLRQGRAIAGFPDALRRCPSVTVWSRSRTVFIRHTALHHSSPASMQFTASMPQGLAVSAARGRGQKPRRAGDHLGLPVFHAKGRSLHQRLSRQRRVCAPR